MRITRQRLGHLARTGWLLLALAGAVQAQYKRNLAPGFSGLAADARVVIAPVDVELFSISAGGVMEIGRAHV